MPRAKAIKLESCEVELTGADDDDTQIPKVCHNYFGLDSCSTLMCVEISVRCYGMVCRPESKSQDENLDRYRTRDVNQCERGECI